MLGLNVDTTESSAAPFGIGCTEEGEGFKIGGSVVAVVDSVVNAARCVSYISLPILLDVPSPNDLATVASFARLVWAIEGPLGTFLLDGLQ